MPGCTSGESCGSGPQSIGFEVALASFDVMPSSIVQKVAGLNNCLVINGKQLARGLSSVKMIVQVRQRFLKR